MDARRKRGATQPRGFEIIVFSTWNPNDHGIWITRRCTKEHCKNSVGYWSNSGRETRDLSKARCEVHVR